MTPFGAALRQLLAALDRLEIRFVVGGSIASGAHGLPRQTNGVDIVADVTKDGARELCEALGTCFYADAEEVTRAIEDGRPFNVIQGVIQVQSSRLDQAYLDRWAAELGITDLLKRAFS